MLTFKKFKSILNKTLAENAQEDLRNISDGIIHRDPRARAAAVSHPNATKAHLDKGIKDPHPDVRLATVSHPNATKAHLDLGKNDRNKSVREASEKHKNA